MGTGVVRTTAGSPSPVATTAAVKPEQSRGGCAARCRDASRGRRPNATQSSAVLCSAVLYPLYPLIPYSPFIPTYPLFSFYPFPKNAIFCGSIHPGIFTVFCTAMVPLSYLPALKLLAGYAAGCCLGLLLPGSALPLYVLVLFVLLVGVWRRSRPLLFWPALVLAGLWTAGGARGLPLRVESRAVSELPAVVWGRIERVVSRDSTSVRCIVSGTVDTRPMKAHHNTRMMLVVVRPDSTVRRYLQAGTGITASAVVRLPRRATLPGEFNEQLFYSSLGVEWLGVVSTRSIAFTGRQASLAAIVQQAGDGVSAELCRLFPERSRGMAVALVTGDRSLLSRETRDIFTVTGTTHVLAVSGLHVGILAAVILLPLARLRRPVLRLTVFSLVLLAYTMLTGMQPSMVRAAIMAVLVLIAADAQRESNLLNILCFTVVVMTVFDPPLLFSIGFHLSVVSLAGIALLYPAVDRALGLLMNRESRAVQFVRSSLAVTLSASAAVSPVVAWSFSVFSVVSPLANLFVIPLTSLGMIYTLCALFAAQVAEPELCAGVDPTTLFDNAIFAVYGTARPAP